MIDQPVAHPSGLNIPTESTVGREESNRSVGAQ